YTIYLPAGSYLVAAMPLPGYVAPAIRMLEVREDGCFNGADLTVRLDCNAYDWTYTHGAVRGIVRDDAGTPLPGVDVELKGVDYSQTTTTGADGSYVLGAVPGDYAIVAHAAPGYTTPLAPLLVTLTDSIAPLQRDLVYRRDTRYVGVA